MTKRGNTLGSLWKKILFPHRCVFCRRILPLSAQKSVCLECMRTIPFCLSKNRCRQCGRPIAERQSYCFSCSSRTKAHSGISAPYFYQEPAKSAILRFKKEKYQSYANTFAIDMAIVLNYECGARVFDMIVSVPPRLLRMKNDGYDQAERLAQALGRQLKLPYVSGVMKQKEKRRKQSSLSAEERVLNAKGNYLVNRPKLVEGKRILLVDDVCTTGATLNECAKILKEAGAKEIYCAVASVVGR